MKKVKITIREEKITKMQDPLHRLGGGDILSSSVVTNVLLSWGQCALEVAIPMEMIEKHFIITIAESSLAGMPLH